MSMFVTASETLGQVLPCQGCGSQMPAGQSAVRVSQAPPPIMAPLGRFVFHNHQCLAMWTQRQALTYVTIIKNGEPPFVARPDETREFERQYRLLSEWALHRKP